MVRRIRKTVGHDRSFPDGQSSDTESEAASVTQQQKASTSHQHQYNSTTTTTTITSPLLLSRNEEKEALQSLNNRLAAYIEYIQTHGLSPDVKEYFDGVVLLLEGKLDDYRKLYADELSAVRRLLDSTSYRLAESQVDAKKESASKNEALSELDRVKEHETRLADQLVGVKSALARAESELELLRGLPEDYEKLMKQHEILKRQLESETLKRTDMGNRVLTLKEQLEFKDKLLSEHENAWDPELVRAEIEAIANQTKVGATTDFADKLEQLRGEMVVSLRSSMSDIRQHMQSTLDANRLKSDADQKAADAAQTSQRRLTERLSLELSDKSRQLTSNEAELKAAQSNVDRMRDRLAEMENELKNIRGRQRGELDKLFAALDDKTKQCANLASIKVQLDAEIAMYRKLLESEESRCELSPGAKLTSKPVVASTSQVDSSVSRVTSSRKRHAVDIDSASEASDTNQSGSSSTNAAGQRHRDPYDTRSGRYSSSLYDKSKLALNKSSTSVSYRHEHRPPTTTASSQDNRELSAIRITCSSDGPIHFSNADPGTGLLRIYNAGDKPASIGEWRLHFGPTKPDLTDHVLLHAFPKRLLLQPHSELKVYISTIHDNDKADTAAKRPKTDLESTAMYLVTDQVVWPTYSSVIALQGTDGSIQALCEMDPLDSKKTFRSIGKRLLTTIDEVLSDDSDAEEQEGTSKTTVRHQHKTSHSGGGGRYSMPYTSTSLLTGRRITLVAEDKANSSSCAIM